jgi:hypothetical protein
VLEKLEDIERDLMIKIQDGSFKGVQLIEIPEAKDTRSQLYLKINPENTEHVGIVSNEQD